VKDTGSVRENLKRARVEVGEIANLDPNREEATGIPEVILARGKRPEDLQRLAKEMLERKGKVIITKAEEKHYPAIEKIKAIRSLDRRAGTAVLKRVEEEERKAGKVAVFAAGTADIPVAEEARVVLEELGCEVVKAYDIGVAGIHRVLPWVEKAVEEDVDVVIVVAGMEGALASVVKAMIDVPVIGVPTSVGYGYGGGGTSALMSMLQSCSPGVTVVNIDNGFGAAAAAYLICRRIDRHRS